MTKQPPSNRLRRYVIWIMAVLILVPSMMGFTAKFIELIHTFRDEQEGAFAMTPILNYLLASLGFFCMLIWATFNGMFRDIERPKHHMLEIEEALNRRAKSKF